MQPLRKHTIDLDWEEFQGGAFSTPEHELWAAVFFVACREACGPARRTDTRQARKWLFDDRDPQRPGTCRWIVGVLGLSEKLPEIREAVKSRRKELTGRFLY